MKQSPLISVVVPTYNQRKLLMETLESVFAQTLTDFEVVVVNDGCTDDTAEHLAAIADPRLRIITQSNGGIGAARNRGLREAKGKYIATLDHDDLWAANKLRAQADALESHPDWIAASCPIAWSDAPSTPAFDVKAICQADESVMRPILTLRRCQFITTSSMMFRNLPGFEPRYGEERGAIEDVEFYVQLFHRGSVGIAGEEVLLIYRMHDANFSKQASYFGTGLKRLRRLFSQGAFSYLDSQEHRDWQAMLAHVGRIAAMMQLQDGKRRQGLSTYSRELLHQIRQQRFKFILAYPLLVLASTVTRK